MTDGKPGPERNFGPPRFGIDHHNWTGGRTISEHGYVKVKAPGNPMVDRSGYVYEHRLVASEMLGRSLLSSEIVHHIDGNKQNNSPDNLRVEPSRFYHKVEHRIVGLARRKPDDDNLLIECACGCGKQFLQYDRYGRPRIYISGHDGVDRDACELIKKYLRDGICRCKDIMNITGFNRHKVNSILTRLRSIGMVTNESRNNWVICDGK